jgi:glycosyltransferase involved in cell wall biosynthesis
MKKPKVSVIIPSFNREKYICDNIDSLLNQSLADIEIIIVDDCSTDNTVNLIRKYKDKRIKLIKSKVNLGVAASRNIGFRHAIGEYIAISDSDDINHKDRLFKQSAFLDENLDIDVVVCKVQEIKDNRYGAIHSYDCTDEAIRANWLFQPGIPSFMMFRKDKITKEKLLYHDESFKAAVDYQWYTQLNNNIKIHCIPEVLYYYRRHKEQISTAGYKIQQQFADKIRLEQLKRLDINPLPEELIIHTKLSNAQIKEISPKEYIKFLEWGHFLLDSNRMKKIYSQTYLESIIAKKLFHITEAVGYYQKALFDLWDESVFSNYIRLPEQELKQNKVEQKVQSIKNNSVIVGSKRMAYYFKETLNNYGIRVISYIDSNSSIVGKEIEGCPIIGIENLKNKQQITYFISVLSEERYVIKENLINRYGINPQQIVIIDELI